MKLISFTYQENKSLPKRSKSKSSECGKKEQKYGKEKVSPNQRFLPKRRHFLLDIQIRGVVGSSKIMD